MSKWVEKELDKLCCIEKGDQLNKLALEVSGTYPCINGGIEPSGYTEKYNRVEDTISISEGGNSCGYVNLMKQKFWAGGHCYTLKENSKLVDKIFLYCVLKYNQEKIMQLRVGSGLPNIQRNALAEYKIYYPEDIEEQKRIAAVLTKTDELIEATQKLIDKQKNIKTGLMQTLLTCGIDDKGVIRSRKTHKFKNSELGQIPVEWECVELGKICSKIQDGTHFSPPTSLIGEFKYITSKNIRMTGLDLTDIEFVDKTHHDEIYKHCPVVYNDVLLTKDGANTGNICLNSLKEEFSLLSSVAFIRGKKHVIRNGYIVFFFSTDKGQNLLTEQMSGNAITRITLTKIIGTLIVFPKSLEEQDRIVTILQQQDQIIKDLESEKQKYIDIKKGLMADLLSGKVKVSV